MEENRAQKGPQEWFLDAHPERGTLRVQVSTGRGLFPVEGARVEVYRDFGDQRVVFYEGVTDRSGIVDDIRLPAGISGTTYQAAVRHPQCSTVDGRPVTVFPRIETVLAVSLEPA